MPPTQSSIGNHFTNTADKPRQSEAEEDSTRPLAGNGMDEGNQANEHGNHPDHYTGGAIRDRVEWPVIAGLKCHGLPERATHWVALISSTRNQMTPLDACAGRMFTAFVLLEGHASAMSPSRSLRRPEPRRSGSENDYSDWPWPVARYARSILLLDQRLDGRSVRNARSCHRIAERSQHEVQ